MHKTTIGTTHTGWRLVGHRIEILYFCDNADTTPAYRLRNSGNTVPIPLGQCGLVAFDERALPDLAQVREWFPRHFRLWDAVRTQYWEALLSAGGARPTDEWHTVAAERE
ncbi:hypothetical protein OHA40_33950 [Nocardia sp. NBC_00508]|uniref:hypothetical protein n=1 Tax=Nocardia sp. NBC_00508 TaxID=2975992 RepID=UPI002E81927B|nr:hypothetical protein [Nocardia sp. NBC_00508]WUD66490.1 hypothetical protein OHA40_33950 [Nocardia sp. NBC_00508]